MLYTYRAVDQTGKTLSGEREAGSERELADALRQEGAFLLEAGARGAASAPRSLVRFGGLAALFGGVSLVERMALARNLAVMISSGLPLTRGLEALEQQSSPRLRAIISGVRAGVMRGETLAASLRPHERIFGPLFINMIEAGEVSGNLERVLRVLARQMQREHALRSKVRGALIYPAIILVAMAGIGILMMAFVVPTLTQTFAELGIDLPVTTRIIIGGSNLLLNYALYIALAFGIAIAAAIRILRSSRGKRVFDSVILQTPVFGPLVQKYNSARLSRTLASLISSGLPITRSLDITASVVGNYHFRDSLRAAAAAIQRGRPLHETFESRPDLFPPMVTQMISVGEETGTLSRMLLRLALFYEEEVADITKNLSSIVEPVLMVVIGAVVGFFAVSMVQPIYGGLGNL